MNLSNDLLMLSQKSGRMLIYPMGFIHQYTNHTLLVNDISLGSKSNSIANAIINYVFVHLCCIQKSNHDYLMIGTTMVDYWVIGIGGNLAVLNYTEFKIIVLFTVISGDSVGMNALMGHFGSCFSYITPLFDIK